MICGNCSQLGFFDAWSSKEQHSFESEIFYNVLNASLLIKSFTLFTKHIIYWNKSLELLYYCKYWFDVYCQMPKPNGSCTRLKKILSWYTFFIFLFHGPGRIKEQPLKDLSSLCPELFFTLSLLHCLIVDLCRPMLVGLLSEDVETNRKSASEPLFLRVWQGHLLEVDMHQGCVKTRVELDSLRDVVTTEATCTVEVRWHFLFMKLYKLIIILQFFFCFTHSF